MVALVEQKKTALAELCQQYRVQRLYVFGSAVMDRFDIRRSDIDFLVRFSDRQPTGEYADRYLGFAEALEQLFDRPVDLVTEESIRNPFFRREVEATRQLLYEQPNKETSV
ncbi:MAG: nucleotidyltransferase domain-containing protein [Phycisphaerae bacterium]|nr:nucleotidyltransferase domain-containing protein [Phycisphaerae bacterium]